MRSKIEQKATALCGRLLNLSNILLLFSIIVGVIIYERKFLRYLYCRRSKERCGKNTVLLLEKLGCNVIFLEKQGYCGQPALNSGYTKQAIPGMKNLVETFEVNDYPIVCPCRFLCLCYQKLS